MRRTWTLGCMRPASAVSEDTLIPEDIGASRRCYIAGKLACGLQAAAVSVVWSCARGLLVLWLRLPRLHRRTLVLGGWYPTRALRELEPLLGFFFFLLLIFFPGSCLTYFTAGGRGFSGQRSLKVHALYFIMCNVGVNLRHSLCSIITFCFPSSQMFCQGTR